MQPPVFILVRPQLGENIGAVARAMANFGLSELRLVAPRDGWPNVKAMEMAGHAGHLIEAARVFENVTEALHDITHAYATTARPREMEKRVVDVEEAMEEVSGQVSEVRKSAILFGPERTGLTNEDLMLADAVVTIPTAPEYTSLNIAQSSVVVAYEWWKHVIRATCDVRREAVDTQHGALSTKHELQGLFDHLEGALDEIGYWRVADKKPLMWQNLRNIFVRASLTTQEISSLRGMVKDFMGRKRR